ncbi:sugar transferase [Bacteroides ovatus]|uniref:sugar transferase n=1 Tax=Bacteroides ovatus TaxID=28116 RepID=UPI0018CA4C54|nr:sugar transferase [Bacteroides ovatus]MBG9220340.1 sugar transferase [Bacteroides ovatus]MBG9233462.1 sugar transferase [Bacteroides ovatus]
MYRFWKRAFDLCSSLSLLIAISPIFIILAILVRVNLGSPIIFRQIRTGKGMRNFSIMKFRTMTNAKDKNGNLLPDEKRFTKFGRWLRSSSLDELPELLNIINGDMSVIGPRPLPPIYNEYYRPEEMARFDVRGGLVTPDSVDSNPIISWDTQFEYEADYGENLSFKKDLEVFIGVFRILFLRTKTDYGEYVRKPLNVERANMKQE